MLSIHDYLCFAECKDCISNNNILIGLDHNFQSRDNYELTKFRRTNGVREGVNKKTRHMCISTVNKSAALKRMDLYFEAVHKASAISYTTT